MWIDVDNNIPPDGETVLFLEPFTESLCGDIKLGFFQDGEWFDQHSKVITNYISHWMTIPDTTEIIDTLEKQHALL